MRPRFPTRGELKCGGGSFIIAQVLFIIAVSLNLIDVDHYAVTTEAQVIDLHNALSSDAHRAEVQLSCVCLWAAFPLMFIALHAIKKFLSSLMFGTNGECVVFLLEKAFLVFVICGCILFPIMNLMTVSYEWSFHETTADPDVVPTGYYMQLYALTLQMELVDVTALAEGVTMVCFFLMPRIIMYGAYRKMYRNEKFVKFIAIIKPSCFAQDADSFAFTCCREVVSLFLMISSVAVFLIVLFEFAESGFFSINGMGKFLMLWLFLLKIFIGVRMVQIGSSEKYDRLKNVFGEHADDDKETNEFL